MEVIFHNKFLKLFSKTQIKIQRKFEQSLTIFQDNPFDSRLNNHALQGSWQGFRSINITGDFRAIYWPRGNQTAEFFAIGTHSQLYG